MENGVVTAAEEKSVKALGFENGVVTAAEEKSVKALGFLRNKGTNNFSARVITVNGKITAEQTACLAEAAKLYGNGVVTLTTRQTIECQGVPFDKIEEFRSSARACPSTR